MNFGFDVCGVDIVPLLFNDIVNSFNYIYSRCSLSQNNIQYLLLFL